MKQSKRTTPINMTSEEFKTIGHELVDRIAELLDSMDDRPVTAGLLPDEIRKRIDSSRPLPQSGSNSTEVVRRATRLLTELSLYNGHPKFGGYITSSPAPIGMLADLLAAAVNPNVGGWSLSPVASEIELQTVRWIAELIGFPSSCGGLMVSGGNMANMTCLLAARAAKAEWNIREQGMTSPKARRMLVYASSETHTWLYKCADMMGIGTDSIRWIATDSDQRIDTARLEKQIKADLDDGHQPFCVVGSAGTVSGGLIDPLDKLADICKLYNLWFHIDGAYGGVGAVLPELQNYYKGMELADSIAVDPHKWLYAPIECGCSLVRDPDTLRNAFSYHPPYYHFGQEAVSFVDYGPQNSRGFRALKVWMALLQVGRSGYEEMIREDCRLARCMYDIVSSDPEFEPFACHLSITTFRYVPTGLTERTATAEVGSYLNDLNKEIQDRLERSGEAFVSNAVIRDCYCLRNCIVNFRTSQDDIEGVIEIIRRLGRETDAEMRPSHLR